MAYTMVIVVAPDAIDELGHVNNAVYLQYVEAISRAHPESVGLDGAAFLALGGTFVVRRHTIDYLAPAFAGDHLELRTWISETRGSRAVREVEIWRGETKLSAAHTEWVWIDPSDGRPKRMPPEISERLNP